LLGEQFLRLYATARPTRFIDAPLDDYLASVGEANTDNLGQMRHEEEDGQRSRAQKGLAPLICPDR
jgi:hypothetical protein